MVAEKIMFPLTSVFLLSGSLLPHPVIPSLHHSNLLSFGCSYNTIFIFFSDNFYMSLMYIGHIVFFFFFEVGSH